MGIIADFSEWQQTIDWSKVSEQHKNGTLDGVILRVQSGYTHPDSKYEEYVAGCRQYSIPFGTYAYFKGASVPDSITEAKNALALTDKDSKCFIVDIEEATMSDLVSGGQAFVDYLKNNGMQNVGIYSYTGFYNAHNLAAIKCDWHWIAAYGVNDGQPHTDPNIGENLWQFTSVAHIDGVPTNVDESKEINFPYFGSPVSTPVTIAKPLMVVKVLVETDVRAEPSHTSGFIGNVHPPQMFNVWQHTGDWHYIIFDASKNICGWVDGNGGKNLYWLDNPALKQAPQPQPIYHTVVAGDTVGALAKANGVTIDQIKAWNNLDANYTIYAGKKIRVK